MLEFDSPIQSFAEAVRFFLASIELAKPQLAIKRAKWGRTQRSPSASRRDSPESALRRLSSATMFVPVLSPLFHRIVDAGRPQLRQPHLPETSSTGWPSAGQVPYIARFPTVTAVSVRLVAQVVGATSAEIGAPEEEGNCPTTT